MILFSCSTYNFSSISLNSPHTFQVNHFQNNTARNAGSTFEPGIQYDLTQALQNRIQNVSKQLRLVTKDGDLIYEGEIIEYRITPIGGSSTSATPQNRLTITVKVSFENMMEENTHFEKRFSFFYDYAADKQLSEIKNQAHPIIFERITQDILKVSLSSW